jgi:heat-inducible transcriptional repressor
MRVLDKNAAERRRSRILHALVSTYISTGAPVPSSRVLARSRLDLSPATVRTVMAQLDELGLTVQPHTSAGRIPTQEGLRAFVESLVVDDGPARNFWSRVENDYDLDSDEDGSVGGLLERCCALLSEASGEAGVVLSPSFANDIIREIKLVEVDPGRILAVVISDLGIVTSNTIHLGQKLGYFNLKRIEEYLNGKLRGSGPAGALAGEYYEEVERLAAERLYNEVVLKYLINGGTSGKRELYLEGFAKLFDKKEMRSPDRAHAAVRFFEDKTTLIDVLSSCQNKDGVTVLVGEEIQPGQEGPGDLSLIASSYKASGVPVGALGVIGSMRLPYRGVIPLVEHGAIFLSRRLSEILGRGKIAFDSDQPFAMALRTRQHGPRG